MLASKLLSASLVKPSEWDVTTATYLNKSFDFSNEVTEPLSLSFRPDGSWFYIKSGSDLYGYSMSVPWALDTATFQSSHTIPSLVNFDGRHYFREDGLKLYVTDGSFGYATKTLREYDMSSAWDLSTLSLVNSFDTDAAFRASIFFDPSGEYLFLSRLQSSYCRTDKFVLGTAWDISTAVYDSNIQIDDAGADYTQGVIFKQNGLKIINLVSFGGTTNPAVLQRDLSSAWDISYGGPFPPAPNDGFHYLNEVQSSFLSSLEGFWIKPDGKRMYVSGGPDDKIYEYSIG